MANYLADAAVAGIFRDSVGPVVTAPGSDPPLVATWPVASLEDWLRPPWPGKASFVECSEGMLPCFGVALTPVGTVSVFPLPPCGLTLDDGATVPAAPVAAELVKNEFGAAVVATVVRVRGAGAGDGGGGTAAALSFGAHHIRRGMVPAPSTKRFQCFSPHAHGAGDPTLLSSEQLSHWPVFPQDKQVVLLAGPRSQHRRMSPPIVSPLHFRLAHCASKVHLSPLSLNDQPASEMTGNTARVIDMPGQQTFC